MLLGLRFARCLGAVQIPLHTTLGCSRDRRHQRQNFWSIYINPAHASSLLIMSIIPQKRPLEDDRLAQYQQTLLTAIKGGCIATINAIRDLDAHYEITRDKSPLRLDVDGAAWNEITSFIPPDFSSRRDSSHETSRTPPPKTVGHLVGTPYLSFKWDMRQDSMIEAVPRHLHERYHR